MKYIIYFLLTWLLLFITPDVKAQAKKDTTTKKTTPKQQVTDSLAIISLNDLKAFNQYLQKNYSYETYINFKPENVLSELYNFKLRQIYSKP